MAGTGLYGLAQLVLEREISSLSGWKGTDTQQIISTFHTGTDTRSCGAFSEACSAQTTAYETDRPGYCRQQHVAINRAVYLHPNLMARGGNKHGGAEVWSRGV